MHQLVIKGFSIVDARCNHEAYVTVGPINVLYRCSLTFRDISFDVNSFLWTWYALFPAAILNDYTYQNTRRHILHDNLHSHLRESLKSHTWTSVFCPVKRTKSGGNTNHTRRNSGTSGIPWKEKKMPDAITASLRSPLCRVAASRYSNAEGNFPQKARELWEELRTFSPGRLTSRKTPIRMK